MPEDLNLSKLKPAQKRREPKRVGRGLGSGKGRFAGRGVKGAKQRSGSHTMRPGYEGGQNPVYMRLGKQRGPNKRKSMPMGPHRTETVPVNLRDLERVFDDGAEVTPETLVEKRVLKNTRTDVKILGVGALSKRLTVTAHAFSASAAAKIEAAGGTVRPLREPAGKTERRKAPETEEVAAAETAAAAQGATGEPDEAVDREPEGAAQAPEGEG